ncbi:WXG100 family type VII secretion target [Bifidobacterium sp. LC6]|uniref:WXG100 family type VII secretion target n=1 Tax=Bifidobacterium colobi TaxID=2809026 RepID=A0ABS5UTZ3_9BIFI|nr:WXG100 family type VII secretion target [Bifidobacterium colobi]MBT1174510.1 WXG100 family type VII secretion target [Bifidobacterium colobi]
MANVNVTYDDLQRVKGDLEKGRQNLVSTLDQLKKTVDDLVTSGFVTDKASGAFQSSYEQFTKGATETVNGLNGMQQFLQKTQDALTQLDSSLASALNS